MATGSVLKRRIEILEMAEAQGKELRPEHRAELEAYRTQGLAKGSAVGGKPNDGERTAAFLGTRLEGSLKDIADATGSDPDAAKPSVLAETVRGIGLGETAGNFVTSSARQRVDAAQEDALDAALTLGTGAAYSKEQLAGYKKAYFPQIGDDDATVAAKTVRFNRLIEAARVKAGSAATNIDDALGKTAARSGLPADPAAPAAPATEVVDSATALGRTVDNQIDKAVGIVTPQADPNAPLRVDVAPAGGDARLKDPVFQAGLEKLLNSNASGDDIRAYWASHGGAPVNSSPAGTPTSSPRKGTGGIETTEAGLRGVLDTVSLGMGDELQAVGDTIADGGTFKDNLLRQRATDRFDEEYHPVARTAGQIVGGVALPLGEARSAAALGRVGGAYGALYGFGSGDGDIGTRLKGAALGGATGAVTGAALGAGGNALASRLAGPLPRAPSNIEGRAALEAGQRIGVDVMPADVGGALTRGATSVASSLPGSMTTVRNAARRVVDQAGEARDRVAAGIGQAVEPEAAGEAATRGAQSFITRTRGVGDGAYDRAERLAGPARVNPVSARQALDRNIAELAQVPGGADGLAELQNLRDQLAPDPRLGLGRLPKKGVASAIRGKDGKVYTGDTHFTAAEKAKAAGTGAADIGFVSPDGTFLNRKDALKFVNSNGERIKPSENMPGELDALDYKEQSKLFKSVDYSDPAEKLSDGTFTVAGVRGMRTALRDRFIGQGLRGSDLERRVNQVVDAASEDVVKSLRDAGNESAARAYGVADRYWRNRLRVIDEVLQPIIGQNGEKSGEAVLQSLNTAAKGNSARLSSFVRSLPAEESATVRATMISQLGRASNGTQDATGTAFSLPQFLTHWNAMQPGAKRALFDPASRRALDDLAIVANGSKQAQRFQNFSNTSLATGALTTAGSSALGLATLGKTLALEYGAGRLLSSPRFAQWLARAPSQRNPMAAIGQLGQIAAREPAIANEVLQLQRRLSDGLAQIPQRAAAEGEGDQPGPAVPQRRELQPAN